MNFSYKESNIGGVYKITCSVNGFFYIGSTRLFKKRYLEHFNSLKRNTHYNNHLQKAWNKYGDSNFLFEILECCENEKIITREQYYLDNLRPFDRGVGFNKSPKAGSVFGIKRSKFSIQKRIETIEARTKTKMIISPSGETVKFKSMAKFARENNICKQSLSQVLNGKIDYTGEGWRLPGTKIFYHVINPNNQTIEIKFMKLRQFCKENNLGYVSMRKLLGGLISNYKGWKIN